MGGLRHRISEAGIRTLISFEHFSPVPYMHGDDIVRIGYGHSIWSLREVLRGEAGTAHAIRAVFPSPVTRQQAMGILDADLFGVDMAIHHEISAPLTQTQHDALAILFYCLYQEEGDPLRLLRLVLSERAPLLVTLINNGMFPEAAEQMDIPSASPLRTARRLAARQLFLQDVKELPCSVASVTTSPISSGCFLTSCSLSSATPSR